MTPAAIIREAQTDGVTLSISPTGTIKASGDGAAVNRWLSVIREHKAEIIGALKACAGDAATIPQMPAEDEEATECMASCCECRHFMRADHPHLGHCALGEPEAAAGIWGTDRRWCRVFQPHEVSP